MVNTSLIKLFVAMLCFQLSSVYTFAQCSYEIEYDTSFYWYSWPDWAGYPYGWRWGYGWSAWNW